MGGKKWHKQQDYQYGGRQPWGRQQPGYGRSWQVWPGAYSSPRSQRLHYDQVTVPEDKPAVEEEPASGSASSSALMRKVQKSLSAARKSDNRIRRLREDRKTKEAQWIQFQKESREAFLQEKQRYQAALAKIDEDIQSATAAGQESADMVQALVLHGMEAKMKQPGRMDESDGSWEALIREAEPQMEPGFLKDALLAAQRMSQPSTAAMPDGSLISPEAAARFFQAAMAAMAPAPLGPTLRRPRRTWRQGLPWHHRVWVSLLLRVPALHFLHQPDQRHPTSDLPRHMCPRLQRPRQQQDPDRLRVLLPGKPDFL